MTTGLDSSAAALTAKTRGFYRRMLVRLNDAGVPYLVGGAFAHEHFTGIARHTKDLDLFARQADVAALLAVLAEGGCTIEEFAPFWLSKAYHDGDFIDVIHSSGNGIAAVDDRWLAHAPHGEVLGVPVRLCPAEEMLWSKAFIMERERFDGADVLHLIHQLGHQLDWRRVLERFGEAHWRVLLAHLTLFGFVYPSRRAQVPDWVMVELVRRLRREQRQPPERAAICHGTVLSRQQYKIDLERWGYRDGRLAPGGTMTRADAELWEARRLADEERTVGTGA